MTGSRQDPGRDGTEEPAAAVAASEVEMAISHADFRRTLLGAFGAAARDDGEGRLVVTTGSIRLVIHLGVERERRLGQFRLPVTTVRLAFYGGSPDDVAALSARFERAFQRGGG